MEVPTLLLEVNVTTMKKIPLDESLNSDDELLAEYHFDYQKSKPNRFAAQSGKPSSSISVSSISEWVVGWVHLRLTLLIQFVAQVFITPEI